MTWGRVLRGWLHDNYQCLRYGYRPWVALWETKVRLKEHRKEQRHGCP